MLQNNPVVELLRAGWRPALSRKSTSTKYLQKHKSQTGSYSQLIAESSTT